MFLLRPDADREMGCRRICCFHHAEDVGAAFARVVDAKMNLLQTHIQGHYLARLCAVQGEQAGPAQLFRFFTCRHGAGAFCQLPGEISHGFGVGQNV